MRNMMGKSRLRFYQNFITFFLLSVAKHERTSWIAFAGTLTSNISSSAKNVALKQLRKFVTNCFFYWWGCFCVSSIAFSEKGEASWFYHTTHLYCFISYCSNQQQLIWSLYISVKCKRSTKFLLRPLKNNCSCLNNTQVLLTSENRSEWRLSSMNWMSFQPELHYPIQWAEHANCHTCSHLCLLHLASKLALYPGMIGAEHYYFSKIMKMTKILLKKFAE